MKEIGVINRDVAAVLSKMGHQDQMIICDAGFAIPNQIPVVDLSIDENVPRLEDVLQVIKRYFSIETAVVANEFETYNPGKAARIKSILSTDVAWSAVDHSELKLRAQEVKAIIRTGDFAAYSNLLLVSGSGKRWTMEKS